MRYFGKDLVLWRADDGTPAMFDAHCPHLGAHLGYGGAVEADGLRCPFHKWRYGLDGRCNDIPYSEARPAGAVVASWPVVETGGMIYAAHDADGGVPTWRYPERPEWGTDGWVGYEQISWTVHVHAQEVAENVPDMPHFLYVHNTGVIPRSEVHIDGDVYRQTMTGHADDGTEVFRIIQEAHGVGLIWLTVDGPPDTRFLTAVTPIDESTCELRLLFLLHEGPGATQISDAGRASIQATIDNTANDLPIWEHKAYLDRPLLVAGDGPINQMRRWARQFYPETPVAEPVATR